MRQKPKELRQRTIVKAGECGMRACKGSNIGNTKKIGQRSGASGSWQGESGMAEEVNLFKSKKKELTPSGINSPRTVVPPCGTTRGRIPGIPDETRSDSLTTQLYARKFRVSRFALCVKDFLEHVTAALTRYGSVMTLVQSSLPSSFLGTVLSSLFNLVKTSGWLSI